MCGIVAYVGHQQAFPILLEGLSRLEYRGYDSSGISIINDAGVLNTFKKKGKVQEMQQSADTTKLIWYIRNRSYQMGNPR